MSEKEKKDQNVDEILEIIQTILDFNKDAQNFFYPASKIDKEKLKPKQKSDQFLNEYKCQKIDLIL